MLCLYSQNLSFYFLDCRDDIPACKILGRQLDISLWIHRIALLCDDYIAENPQVAKEEIMSPMA